MQQEISLYIDLHEGQKVDLETAARSALAFDLLVKEVAFAIEPFVTVRIELESGTEGSLSLNSLISSVRIDRATLKAIAWAVAAFFVADTASYTYQHVLDRLLAEPEVHEGLAQEDIEAIARQVAKVVESKAADRQASKVYHELQRDDAVRGVGVSPHRNRRPTDLVPRSEFQKRGRIIQESETTGTRSETTVETVTLVSPVLVQGSARQWKFKQGKKEFGAPIKDERFLSRILSGREPVPMADGIIMKVVLTVKEERKDGLWQVKSRTVDEVIEITPPPEQDDLFGTLGNHQQDDN
jgi:hypothetical protein